MGKKSDQAEIERRVTEVYSLILACHSSEKIVQYAAQKWQINRRQAFTLIQRARDRMKEVTDINRKEIYAEALELRREIIRKALEAGKYQAALQAADSREKMRGFFNDFEHWSDDKLLQEVLRRGYVPIDPRKVQSSDTGENGESAGNDGAGFGAKGIPHDSIVARATEVEPTIIPSAERDLSVLLSGEAGDRV